MARTFDLNKILAPVADIVRRLNDRRDGLMAEVELIDNELSRFEGRRSGAKTVHDPAATKRRGKRTRRSREELNVIAQNVISFIRGKGKDGAAAKELQAQFGPLVPSVNAWLKNYSPVKVKTTGSKAQMRYFT
jgi:hypothetical protein